MTDQTTAPAAAEELHRMRHRRVAAMCDPSTLNQPAPAPAPDADPLAAYRSWLADQRDRAAACAMARPLTEEPTPGELAWMHEGARTAYDDAIKGLAALDQPAGEQPAVKPPGETRTPFADPANGLDAQH